MGNLIESKKIEGTGTAGTPTGGVVTTQGPVTASTIALENIGTAANTFRGTVLEVLLTGSPQSGASATYRRTPFVFKSLSAVLITAETTIWTPAAGKKFRLMGFMLTQGVIAGAITLRDNTAGTTILIIPQNTVGVVLISPPMGNGILSAAANNVLTAQGAATETITGFVFGTEE